MMRMSRSRTREQDVGSGVGPADADVVELAAASQGDGAGGADDVGPDAVVDVAGPVAGAGFGPGCVGGGGGGAVGQGPVRPAGVVEVGELVEPGPAVRSGWRRVSGHGARRPARSGNTHRSRGDRGHRRRPSALTGWIG